MSFSDLPPGKLRLLQASELTQIPGVPPPDTFNDLGDPAGKDCGGVQYNNNSAGTTEFAYLRALVPKDRTWDLVKCQIVGVQFANNSSAIFRKLAIDDADIIANMGTQTGLYTLQAKGNTIPIYPDNGSFVNAAPIASARIPIRNSMQIDIDLGNVGAGALCQLILLVWIWETQKITPLAPQVTTIEAQTPNDSWSDT